MKDNHTHKSWLDFLRREGKSKHAGGHTAPAKNTVAHKAKVARANKAASLKNRLAAKANRQRKAARRVKRDSRGPKAR